MRRFANENKEVNGNKPKQIKKQVDLLLCFSVGHFLLSLLSFSVPSLSVLFSYLLRELPSPKAVEIVEGRPRVLCRQSSGRIQFVEELQRPYHFASLADERHRHNVDNTGDRAVTRSRISLSKEKPREKQTRNSDAKEKEEESRQKLYRQ